MRTDTIEPAHESVLAGMIDRVRAATSAGTPLRIRGGGTKDWYGEAAQGELIELNAWHGIIDYDPAELVITARSGTPLREIETALIARNQMLACEPPHFGAAATLGGCVAAGLAGPRRAYGGAIRDAVLGASLLDGNGNVLRFGGTVMKNVAGYDVARLLAGSLGILGIIVDLSMRVSPRPASLATLTFELDETQALHRLNTWAGKPIPITASSWQQVDGIGVLSLRLAGAAAAVNSALATLGGQLVPPAAAESYWEAAREQQLPFFLRRAASQRLWRLSLPSTAPPLALNAARFIEWGGAQRWYVTDEPADTLRSCAARHGGHAVVFRHAGEPTNTFAALPAALFGIHQRLKAAFDPAGIFNRGRMFETL